MNYSKFQFSNPELDKLEFSVNKDFDEEKWNGIEMQSNIEIQLLGSNEAVVRLTLNIGDSTDPQPFSVCVRMGANFTWKGTVEEEKVKQLLNINAPAVLLSYIRPIVASITNSSRFPVLNIPFIDFTNQNHLE